MENLNNKQKFGLLMTLIILVGITLNSLIIGISWINSPTYWSTSHYVDIKGDEHISSSLDSLRDISINSKDINYGEKINCSAMLYYWDSETQKYVATDTYINTNECYAIKY